MNDTDNDDIIWFKVGLSSRHHDTISRQNNSQDTHHKTWNSAKYSRSVIFMIDWLTETIIISTENNQNYISGNLTFPIQQVHSCVIVVL